MAPAVGLEPTTDRLTADCSTTELHRNNTERYTPFKFFLQEKKYLFFTFGGRYRN